MASDEIGKGDTISREQAIAAVLELNATADYSRAIAALRALPSVAPDTIEAEYRDAAVDLMSQAQHAADRFTGMAREIFGQSNFTDRYDDEGRCRNHANALQEKIDRFVATRSTTDGDGNVLRDCPDPFHNLTKPTGPACPNCAKAEALAGAAAAMLRAPSGELICVCTKPNSRACGYCTLSAALAAWREGK